MLQRQCMGMPLCAQAYGNFIAANLRGQCKGHEYGCFMNYAPTNTSAAGYMTAAALYNSTVVCQINCIALTRQSTAMHGYALLHMGTATVGTAVLHVGQGPFLMFAEATLATGLASISSLTLWATSPSGPMVIATSSAADSAQRLRYALTLSANLTGSV